MTFAPPSGPVTPNRNLRTVLLIVGSVALAIILTITAIGATRAAVASGGDDGDGTRVLAGEVASVRVDASVADLTVQLADVDEPTIEWDSGTTGLRLRSGLDGGELDVRVRDRGWGPFGWWPDERGGQASLTVLLPERAAGADLDLEATVGVLDLSGEWGDVRVESTVGEVRLTGEAASLDLTATAGSVSGSGLEIGDVAVESTAGDIDLDFTALPRSIDAATTAGMLRVALPDGEYEIRSETVVGGFTSGLTSAPGAERVYRFESTVGDIVLEPRD